MTSPYTDSDTYTGELIAGLYRMTVKRVLPTVPEEELSRIAAMSAEELEKMACL